MTSRSKCIIIATLIVLVLGTAAATVYLKSRISSLTGKEAQNQAEQQANLVSPPPRVSLF